MVMRIGGLASGMDIDALVEKLMNAERAPLNKLQQKKQTYEWQRDAYRSVNTKLKTFDTYIADNLVLKTLNSKTATSSNSNLVSATATGQATGTLSIEGVSQLATNARAVGNQISANGSTKMSDLGATGTIAIKAIQADGTLAKEATEIEITSDMTVNQFVSKLNASNAGVNAVFENGRFSFTAKNSGDLKSGEEMQITSGKEIFEKLGFFKEADGTTAKSTFQTVDGKNAIFQVNGIATERASNTFSISGYNVTLKETFNAEQAKAEKYNAAYTEWKNTSSTTYNNSIAVALTSFNNATTAYNTANTDYLVNKKALFGIAISDSEKAAYDQMKAAGITTAELTTMTEKTFKDDAAYQKWLNDNTTDADLKTKLKNANATLTQFNSIKSLDSDKITTLSNSAEYISDADKAAYKKINNPQLAGSITSEELTKMGEQSFVDDAAYQKWLNDNTTDADLKTKLKDANVTFEQFNAIKSLTETDLKTLSNQSKHDTLGTSFLSKLTDDEQALLEASTLRGSDADFTTQINTWKASTNEAEKALGEKLAALNDSQKSTLRQLSTDELGDLAEFAASTVDVNEKLNTKNIAENTHKQLVDRQVQALESYKDAYEKQFGSVPDMNNIDTFAKVTVPTGATSAVTMTSTTNVDDMMTKIKEFVSTYNGLIKDLNDQIKQSKYRDYAPLTDEQKKEMDEDEIKLWEEKAKSGLLRNDSIIRDGLSNMRSLIYQSNPGLEGSKYNTLFNVGITTSKNYNEGGTLEIDEAKLRKALEEDPDAVERLFKNSDGVKNDPAHGGADTRGYLEKLRESMKTLEINIEKKAGRSTMTDAQYTLGKNLMDTETRIKTWQDKLKTIEERYWKQFTAMESAINKANQQSSLFMQG